MAERNACFTKMHLLCCRPTSTMASNVELGMEGTTWNPQFKRTEAQSQVLVADRREIAEQKPTSTYFTIKSGMMTKRPVHCRNPLHIDLGISRNRLIVLHTDSIEWWKAGADAQNKGALQLEGGSIEFKHEGAELIFRSPSDVIANGHGSGLTYSNLELRLVSENKGSAEPAAWATAIFWAADVKATDERAISVKSEVMRQMLSTQAAARGFLARAHFKKCISAIIAMQARVRGNLARNLVREMKSDFKVLYTTVSEEEVEVAQKKTLELEAKAEEASKAHEALEASHDALKTELEQELQRRAQEVQAFEAALREIQEKLIRKQKELELEELKIADQRATKEEQEKLEKLQRQVVAAFKSCLARKKEAAKAAAKAKKLESRVIRRLNFHLSWGYPPSGKDFLDATCMMLNRDGSNADWAVKQLVDYSNKTAPGISHSGDQMDDATKRGTHTMNLTMADIPADTEWLMFTLSAYNCESIANFVTPSLSLTNADTDDVITTYDNSKAVDSRALLICFARKQDKGKWEVAGMSLGAGGSAHDYTPTKEACVDFVRKATS